MPQESVPSRDTMSGFRSDAARGMRWLLAPATGDAPAGQAWATAALRILVGLLWLYNVAWKRPPDFGKSSGNGLYGFTKDAVDHPVFAPYSWLVEHVILPHITIFGWGVLMAETTLAVLLLSGAYVRIAALVGIAQSLAIGLSVARTPGEWPWSYWMMIGIHVALLFAVAGDRLAVDAVRAGRARALRALTATWGGVAALAGVVAAIGSLGDPTGAAGTRLGGPELSISLGSFNLIGAIALLVCAAGLVAAAFGRRRLGLVTGVVGVLAALLLYVQLPQSDPLLGGTNTSAAFFLTLAVVGLAAYFLGDEQRSGARAPQQGRPVSA